MVFKPRDLAGRGKVGVVEETMIGRVKMSGFMILVVALSAFGGGSALIGVSSLFTVKRDAHWQ